MPGEAQRANSERLIIPTNNIEKKHTRSIVSGGYVFLKNPEIVYKNLG